MGRSLMPALPRDAPHFSARHCQLAKSERVVAACRLAQLYDVTAIKSSCYAGTTRLSFFRFFGHCLDDGSESPALPARRNQRAGASLRARRPPHLCPERRSQRRCAPVGLSHRGRFCQSAGEMRRCFRRRCRPCAGRRRAPGPPGFATHPSLRAGERVSTCSIGGFATFAAITADCERAPTRPPPAHGVPARGLSRRRRRTHDRRACSLRHGAA